MSEEQKKVYLSAYSDALKLLSEQHMMLSAQLTENVRMQGAMVGKIAKEQQELLEMRG